MQHEEKSATEWDIQRGKRCVRCGEPFELDEVYAWVSEPHSVFTAVHRICLGTVAQRESSAAADPMR